MTTFQHQNDPIFDSAKDNCLQGLKNIPSPLKDKLYRAFNSATSTIDLIQILQTTQPTTSEDASAIYQIANNLRMVLRYSKYSANYLAQVAELDNITERMPSLTQKPRTSVF